MLGGMAEETGSATRGNLPEQFFYLIGIHSDKRISVPDQF